MDDGEPSLGRKRQCGGRSERMAAAKDRDWRWAGGPRRRRRLVDYWLVVLARPASGLLHPTVVDGNWIPSAKQQLETQGVVVLRPPKAFEAKSAAARAVEAAREAVEDDIESDVVRHDVSHRGKRRFDIKVQGDEWHPLTERVKTFASPILDELVPSATGCVVSFPGAPDQLFHADGNQAFVNVFLPLVHVNQLNGPTQFALGTHLDEHAVARAPTLQYEDRVDLASPSLHSGDLLVFDYRVLHRGLANRSPTPRPVFYVTFSPPGMKDDINFPSPLL